MSTYFSLAGAVSSVVLIRWSDYVGRKRVMIVMCVGTVLYIVGTALGILVVGRILQGGSVIMLGLAFLIMREHLSGPAFGTCCGTGHRQHPGHVESLAPVHLSSGT